MYEDLKVLFASYQLQGDTVQWWKTVEVSVAKKWKAMRMEFINLVHGSMMVEQYEAKFMSLFRFAKAFVSTEEEKAK